MPSAMSSDWDKLADAFWYRKREVYGSMHWSAEPERFHRSLVAGAPYGGPIATVRNEHVFQPIRADMRNDLQIWTSAGRLISSMPWAHTGLLAMSWSSQERLVCAFESGVVRTFSVMCEPLATFTVDDRVASEGGAVLAAMWPGGVALLTRRHSLFVNASVARSGDACQRYADLRVAKPPLCMCVLPPPREDSGQVQVMLGTAEGPVLLADRHECRDIGLDEGPYVAFAISPSGGLLACLSEGGVFKVLSVEDDFRVVEVASLEIRKRPKQMVWCGDDCVALYLVKVTPSDTMQHVLFVGGPKNDWIPYEYATPIHLVSECDGFRITGADKVEFVQRVPESIEAIDSIGNCDPPAMLCYAHECYEKGDFAAQESLRYIKQHLAEAVATCVDAAQHEFDPAKIKSRLEAAVFGRHFLKEPPDTARFVETCKNCRICLQLRASPYEIPITVQQLEKLGVVGTITRLAQRHHHLLAYRLGAWVGAPCDRVLFHWACERLRAARGAPITDQQLCAEILDKFKDTPGVGFAEVACVAAEMHRPHLATMLVDHEPRTSAQIQVLLQLAREGSDDSHYMMLRLAMERTAQSWDPDLLNNTLTAALGGDPCGRDATLQTFVKLLQEGQHDMQVLDDLLAATLAKGKQFDRCRSLHEQMGRSQVVAQTAVAQALQKQEADERKRWLRVARDMFKQAEGPASLDAEFCADATAAEVELLQAQIALDEKWPSATSRFSGRSLVDTLCRLIEVGEILEADNLHSKMKMSDRRYWRIKVRALADSGKFEDLNMLATHRTSPIGYEPIVEAFLKHGRHDLARTFVPRVRDPEQQASYYTQMGMDEEARAALAQRSDRVGVVGVFQNLLRRG